MGRTKRYDVRTINFGERGNPARILVKMYVKKHGKTALSQLIRKLVYVHLSGKSEFKQYKVDLLIHERKKIGREVAKKLDDRKKLDDELKELGINPEEII